MPLIYTHSPGRETRLALWHITEEESFFQQKIAAVPAIAHPQKRLQHLAGRYLLQFLFTDFPVDLIRIADTRKPYLPGESHHFSISHCGNYAAAIVSTTNRVGVDAELVVRKIDHLIHKFTSPGELSVASTLLADRNAHATLIWSAKESMFKYYSFGKVDFRKHLQITGGRKSGESSGELFALLSAGNQLKHLVIFYRLFGDTILTWIMH